MHMICNPKWIIGPGVAAAISLIGGAAAADTIDPDTFTADLAVGDSVTITKTVVIEDSDTYYRLWQDTLEQLVNELTPDR